MGSLTVQLRGGRTEELVLGKMTGKLFFLVEIPGRVYK
jgi:hypothetical protein